MIPVSDKIVHAEHHDGGDNKAGIEPAQLRFQNNLRWMLGLRDCMKWVRLLLLTLFILYLHQMNRIEPFSCFLAFIHRLLPFHKADNVIFIISCVVHTDLSAHHHRAIYKVMATELEYRLFYDLVVRLRDDTYAFGQWLIDYSAYGHSLTSIRTGSFRGHLILSYLSIINICTF
jgi:hypothetical protein